VLAILVSGATAEGAAVVGAGCVELDGPDGVGGVALPVTSLAVGTVVGTGTAAAGAAAVAG